MDEDDSTYLETKKRKFEPTEEGVIQPRLINIDVNHVIPDELHLLLRVTDRLIENLIIGDMAYDHNVNNVPISKQLDGPLVNKLIKEIRGCGVSFSIYISSKNKREFTSLTGNDRKLLLKFLPTKFKNCQPSRYYEKVESLWRVSIFACTNQLAN